MHLYHTIIVELNLLLERLDQLIRYPQNPPVPSTRRRRI